MSWPAGWTSSPPIAHGFIAKTSCSNYSLGDAWRTGITPRWLDAVIAEALEVRTGTCIKRVDTANVAAAPAVEPAVNVGAAVGSVAWLYAVLRDVDITADINKPNVADACASRALSLLNDDTPLALQWASQAQAYDAGNETAKWCEARAHDLCKTRPGRTMKLYGELADGTGVYAGDAQALLDANGKDSIRQRYHQKREQFSKKKNCLIEKDSTVNQVAKLGDTYYKDMQPKQGKTRIQDALSYAVASPKKGKRNGILQEAWDVVDDGPTQSGAHLRLLERTLRKCQAPSKKIVSCNIMLMNVTDYDDTIFEGVLRDKAKNFARLVVSEEADMFVVQEAPGAALLTKGKKDGNARRCVENGTFCEELLRNLLEISGGDRWVAECIAVPKKEGLFDMGESHVFAWRADAFSLVDGPSLLGHVNNGERFHRPPSWCGFDVLRAGVPTGERLVIVSVHLKAVQNNDTTRTREDVRALGPAVLKLQQQQPGTVIILGDFNAPPNLVNFEFGKVGLGDFVSALDNSERTNMYRFCKNGAWADGHVYDGVYSSNSGRVEGGVLTVSEIDAAYDQMVQKARQLTEGDLGPIMRRIVNGGDVNSGDAEIVAEDGVPSWLRLKVQGEVYRQWGDHVPIYATYSCGN